MNKILYGVIVCPRCKKGSRLIEWDSITHSACVTREMRRAYITLEDDRAYNKGTKNMYKCPKCAEFSRGSLLRVYTNITADVAEPLQMVRVANDSNGQDETDETDFENN